MTPLDIDARWALAQDVMAEASALAQSWFARLDELTVESKGVQDVVSEADRAVERLIRQRLSDAFGDDAFLGEESGATALEGARAVWVVDPIDGTQPFLSGMTSWCVSIGFVADGVLEFGLVGCPSLGEVFAGRRGRGATLNGRPIAPHAGTALTDGIVAVGYSPRIGVDDILPVFDRLLRQGGMFFRNGSGALMLCYVANGRLLGYIEPHLNSWDALGALAVAQAAGCATNDYLTPDALLHGNPIVAGPPALFDALSEVLEGPG